MKNPWETGEEFNGIRPAWCSACDRIEAAKRMSIAGLKSCLAHPDTQVSVKAFITRRLKKLEPGNNVVRVAALGPRTSPPTGSATDGGVE